MPSVVVLTLLLAPTADPVPDFARDVWPVLRGACIDCHGPDKQKGGLRLDSRAAALKGGDSGLSLIPGQPTTSELLRRILLDPGADGVMPARGQPLSRAQVETLRRWIAVGAPWPDRTTATHWAYERPQRPPLPRGNAHPIDIFVRARLEREGLTPSPEAAQAVLLRRLSLDLTGLPPTPAEVEAFLADKSPQAYEKQVDRLLASPQYGVKWARPWLDAARYADSHGFQRDDFRDLWPYRDWVVDALNADLPFDRFTIEQLAGDLLPNPTQEQLIATGFNRSAPTNVEAGSDPEETRVNQVFDRVNTLGTVWLGTTLECAQCHDHKYDPIRQSDYYRLFAFFNGTELEADRTNPKVPGSIQFRGPTLPLKDADTDAERARLTARLSAARKIVAERKAMLAKPDPDGDASLMKRLDRAPREHPLDVVEFTSLNGATHEVLSDKSVLLSGETPDKDTYTVTVRTTLTDIRAFKLEALTHPSLPGTGPGRGDVKRPNFVLSTFAVAATGQSGKAMPVPFTKAWADFAQARFDPLGAIDTDPKTAWAISPQVGRPHWAVFETMSPVGSADGTIFTFTLTQAFGGGRTIGRLRLSAITGDPAGATVPAGLTEALRIPAGKRSPAQAKAVTDYRLSLDPAAREATTSAGQLAATIAAINPTTTLVMKELPESRPTRIMARGDFRVPTATVSPGTPAALPPLKPTPGRPTRLDLAKWLVAPENPLTARVTVNRLWAELFGQGLVLTPEDFGVQGERPTHPELLDWLAVEFVENGWSRKKLLRTIVVSATYRQASRVTPEMLARDDKNLRLARGPRFRLDAEAIRDNALAIAGLLNVKSGGPPVRPYQPEGVWVKVGGQRYDYVVSPGEEKYRRGLYVVWKRGAPYPSFINFDATNRTACRVKRSRSNTPLQALTLLNDPVYIEAAMAFARRVLVEQPGSPAERVAYAFRVAVARYPQPEEAAVLTRLFDTEKAAMASDPAAAKKLIGSSVVPKGVSSAEFAAWYAVCAAILNLDETITKP